MSQTNAKDKDQNENKPDTPKSHVLFGSMMKNNIYTT